MVMSRVLSELSVVNGTDLGPEERQAHRKELQHAAISSSYWLVRKRR